MMRHSEHRTYGLHFRLSSCCNVGWFCSGSVSGHKHCCLFVAQIIQEANTQVGQMKQMEELKHIANILEFDKLKV